MAEATHTLHVDASAAIAALDEMQALFDGAPDWAKHFLRDLGDIEDRLCNMRIADDGRLVFEPSRLLLSMVNVLREIQ